MIFFILLTILWFAIGAASFAFWWTREYPFDSLAVLTMLCASFIGPLAFVLGWLIHGNLPKKKE